MKNFILKLLLLPIFVIPILSQAELRVGISKADITPQTGTPSAGYLDRKGKGMKGTHDPLLAIALFIDNSEKKIALCSVDHLGFTYDMVQEIKEQVHHEPGLEQCEVYIASSHTHSGGGAYLNIPILGESLAGTYNPQTRKFYIDNTTKAIIEASKNLSLAKIGIGYGKAKNLSTYRGQYPQEQSPLSDVALIKITKLDDTPLAALFNFALHPTVLKGKNFYFSSDFVGYTRDHIQDFLGSDVQAIYFNGAQGDIIPTILNDEDPFDSCDQISQVLAKSVEKTWNETETNDFLHIKTLKESYTLKPQITPFGLSLPVDHYKSEMNVIVLNQLHAFITIPGELSSIYDRSLKEFGNKLGFSHVSIFGLTNDAHGYIILPESWRHKTFESGLSFGGENYGEETKNRAEALLKNYAPDNF